jgi:RNA recognition motif-containing protein
MTGGFSFDEPPKTLDSELSALFASAPAPVIPPPSKSLPDPSLPTLKREKTARAKALQADEQALKSNNPKLSLKSRSDRGKAQDEARERNAHRTVFLGNLPSSILSSKSLQRALSKSFSLFGPIESLRYRSIAFDHSAKNKKAAFLKGQFHSLAESCNAYVVYKEEKSVGQAIVSMNGMQWEGRHLRVDSCLSRARGSTEASPPKTLESIPKQCVFVGNLSFDASDEDLWSFFEDVGEIGNLLTSRCHAVPCRCTMPCRCIGKTLNHTNAYRLCSNHSR